MLMPMKAAAEVMASLRWCHASVFTALLSTLAPSLSTKRNKPSLTTITPTSTKSVKGSGAWCGARISPTAVIRIQPAATRSMPATIAAAIGSALPWP